MIIARGAATAAATVVIRAGVEVIVLNLPHNGVSEESAESRA